MIESAIATNTKRIIKEMGLKQNVVAQRVGLTPANFSNLLHGRKVIKDTDVAAIADALGVTPNELFGVPNSDS